MGWFGRGHQTRGRERERRLSALRALEREAAQLRERGDEVAESLRERLRDNHWGETIAAIARRER